MEKSFQVFVYTRISTNKQEKGASLDVQREVIINYLKLHNLPFEEKNFFTEIQSGASDKRPVFAAMRQRIVAEKNIKHVLVYRIDRLTRSVLNGEIIAKEIANSGGSIISVTEGFDDSTDTGRMTRQFLTIMAEQERLSIMKRTKFGRVKAAEKDKKWHCGVAPTGFASVGTSDIRGHGKLAVHPKEAAAVNMIFQLHSEKKSYREIASALAKAGFMSRNNTTYNPGTIKRILDRKVSYENGMKND